VSADRQPETPRSPSRRGALLALAALGAGALWGWPRLAERLAGGFAFQPLADPPGGFRRIAAAGETSGMPNPFIGLDVPGAPGAADTAETALPEAAVRADLCGALFGGPPQAGVVPIAAFSDYNCPFCRVLTERLSALEARAEGGIRITWHEWPQLGPTSLSAARAALAADMQGAYAAFHRRLMRGRFVATPEYLDLLARDIGVDADRLVSDMAGDTVSARLARTDAVARVFGFVGTPAMVVGRTVVVGAISEAAIAALVEQERRDGPLPFCRA
jgi:protein-disulfide isomerase